MHFSMKWDSTQCAARSILDFTSHLCGIFTTHTKTKLCLVTLLTHRLQAQNGREWATVECAHTSTQDYACKRGKGQRKWGYGEGVAGIQLTGTSFQYHLDGDYPVCRDKRREGRTIEEAKRSTGQKSKTRLRSVSSVEKQKAGSIPECR